jgi:hypothetical protein
MKLTAVMVTCPERGSVRAQTLANLGATDWVDDVALAIDDGASTDDRIARIDATWRKALAIAAESRADVALAMEDDLDFNRHLRANLLTWSRLHGATDGGAFFGSLYNPGFYAVHSRPAHQYDVMDPAGCWGGQALLVSPALARYFLTHWSEERGEPDLRMPRLASRLVPIYYHRPSLVQHIGQVSTWGGRAHQAPDFDPDWRAPGLRDQPTLMRMKRL